MGFKFSNIVCPQPSQRRDLQMAESAVIGDVIPQTEADYLEMQWQRLPIHFKRRALDYIKDTTVVPTLDMKIWATIDLLTIGNIKRSKRAPLRAANMRMACREFRRCLAPLAVVLKGSISAALRHFIYRATVKCYITRPAAGSRGLKSGLASIFSGLMVAQPLLKLPIYFHVNTVEAVSSNIRHLSIYMFCDDNNGQPQLLGTIGEVCKATGILTTDKRKPVGYITDEDIIKSVSVHWYDENKCKPSLYTWIGTSGKKRLTAELKSVTPRQDLTREETKDLYELPWY